MVLNTLLIWHQEKDVDMHTLACEFAPCVACPQVAEAEAARDEAVRQGQLHEQELREELHALRKTYEHEVRLVLLD
eukprot:1161829-Pelagomonas_calceolata.AAC.15